MTSQAPGYCCTAQHCMAAKGWNVVVCDESHVMRTSRRPPDALHTEAVASTVRRAARVLFLSGTPALNQPFDLFRQVGSPRFVLPHADGCFHLT